MLMDGQTEAVFYSAFRDAVGTQEDPFNGTEGHRSYHAPRFRQFISSAAFLSFIRVVSGGEAFCPLT